MSKPQLFLLHFAGGNRYSFQFMLPRLADFQVIPLELPGRGNRTREALLRDFDMAALDIFKQIKKHLGAVRYLIYGHSMGAYLGLRVANLLSESGFPPSALIVSGNPGPGMEDDKKRYLLGRKAFVEELRKLGGVPEELLENDELLEFFEPILRADFEVAEKNDISGEAPLNVPLYAMMGSEEEKTEAIGNWGRYTHSEFRSEILDGDHFFIHRHPARIADIIKKCYERAGL